MSAHFRELIDRWRGDADMLERYGDDRVAAVVRLHATELDIAARGHENEALSITQSVAESGYSADYLRELVRSGEIANAGRRGSPKIRRRDLPMKPGHGGAA